MRKAHNQQKRLALTSAKEDILAKNFQKAKETLEAFDPNVVSLELFLESRFLLGETYMGLGNTQEAFRSYIVAASQGHAEAVSKLKSIARLENREQLLGLIAENNFIDLRHQLNLLELLLENKSISEYEYLYYSACLFENYGVFKYAFVKFILASTFESQKIREKFKANILFDEHSRRFKFTENMDPYTHFKILKLLHEKNYLSSQEFVSELMALKNSHLPKEPATLAKIYKYIALNNRFIGEELQSFVNEINKQKFPEKYENQMSPFKDVKQEAEFEVKKAFIPSTRYFSNALEVSFAPMTALFIASGACFYAGAVCVEATWELGLIPAIPLWAIGASLGAVAIGFAVLGALAFGIAAPIIQIAKHWTDKNPFPGDFRPEKEEVLQREMLIKFENVAANAKIVAKENKKINKPSNPEKEGRLNRHISHLFKPAPVCTSSSMEAACSPSLRPN